MPARPKSKINARVRAKKRPGNRESLPHGYGTTSQEASLRNPSFGDPRADPNKIGKARKGTASHRQGTNMELEDGLNRTHTRNPVASWETGTRRGPPSLRGISSREMRRRERSLTFSARLSGGATPATSRAGQCLRCTTQRPRSVRIGGVLFPKPLLIPLIPVIFHQKETRAWRRRRLRRA